jgi:hypothetical protein
MNSIYVFVQESNVIIVDQKLVCPIQLQSLVNEAAFPEVRSSASLRGWSCKAYGNLAKV